ncbi:MAG TPA: hypothetical protein VM621_10420 [Luteibacter sp.]|uniref:hypothetical protein n=1 Tax=Luteibacter sp. TaxID=1886636 RepID=UPI002CB263C0|nr:hypothetical protein [Luteibacter sp.]HVI55453.1 hypothetical protein [Luteibacter sp.]
MEIKIRNQNFGYADVSVVEGSTSIDIGCLSEKERGTLASQLRRAAYELDGIDTVTKESAEKAIRYFEDEGNSDDIDEAALLLEETE